MVQPIIIKTLDRGDISKIIEVLKEPYMLDRQEYYHNYFHFCLQENTDGKRVTFVAFDGNSVTGYVNVIFQSGYPYFKEKNIPEINDLYVVPVSRKHGIGKMLLETCEFYTRNLGYDFIGLGVGLYQSYGNAQRLYTKLGYQLDGNGLMYSNKPVSPGNSVIVDDELLLYLYKKLDETT